MVSVSALLCRLSLRSAGIPRTAGSASAPPLSPPFVMGPLLYVRLGAALTLLLLAVPVLAAGPVVRCEPCDSRALGQCRPLAAECAELVQEPGCGCCMTCALPLGQPCGIYTERCGRGLDCLPAPDEARPLKALLDGRGLCTNVTSSSMSKSHQLLTGGAHPAGNASDSHEDRLASSTETQARPSKPRGPLYGSQHPKTNIIKEEEEKRARSFKVEYDPQSTDTLNSSEFKQETEYGPCRREIERILNMLKNMNDLSPRGFHIPNCDKKGFYKKKQCRPSNGRKRGNCRCVDKYGQTLPGFDGKSKGDVHCYNLESK